MNNELDQTQNLSPFPPEAKKSLSRRTKIIIIALVVIVLAGISYYFRDLFIAATIDGQPISRFAVIGELEKQSGATVLGALIDKRLIDNEIDNQGITIDNQIVQDEIKNIEEQITMQGTTLEAALNAQGLTRAELEEEIARQKKIEKLLADKVQVSDSEIEQYIAANQIPIPEGQEAEYKLQLSEQIKSEKFSQEASLWLSDLRAAANIDYFVEY